MAGFASRAVSQRGIRDKIAITLWGRRPAAQPSVAPVTLSPAGLAHTRAQGALQVNPQLLPAGLVHTRAQGAQKVNPQLLPAGLVHTRAQGAPLVNPKLAPAGLAHTRAQGALQVNPQLRPTGLAHTRALGAEIFSPQLLPAGLTRTRAQGALKVSPQVLPAGQAHGRTLGNPTVGRVTVRALGSIIVTTQGVARPAGQSHTRAQGALSVTGRDIQPLGLARTRAQGNPTLSARVLPAGIAHTRAQGNPAVNTRMIAPAGLVHSGSIAQLVLTPVASDNFNRANGTIGGANNWLANSSGSPSIASNVLVAGTGVGNPGAFRSETYGSDQYSQATVTTGPSAGEWVGLTVRNQDASNGYLGIWFNNSGNLQLQVYKSVAGTFTQLDGTFTVGTSFPAGTVITAVAEGNVIRFSDSLGNASAVIDATFTGGTPGVQFFGTSGALDNWSGGNAASTALAAAATDDFNRANGNVSAGNANWTLMNYPATPATVETPIVSSQLSVQNPPITAHAGDIRTDSYLPDHWSRVEIGSVAMNTSGFVGVVTRAQGSGGTLGNSGYLGVEFGNQIGSGVSYRIYRLDNGTSTLLGVAWGPNIASDPAGTSIILISQGTRHSLRLNGSEVVAVTDATYTGGAPGIMIFPNATADNWSAGNVATGRTLGALAVSSVEILRPAAQTHTRTLGSPVAHGRATITVAALARVRAQGNPTLSGRVLPAGLVHTRTQGSPAVNTLTLAPLAISRA